MFLCIAPVLNQPHLPPCATWEKNAMAFAGPYVLSYPPAVFVNTNNTVYAASDTGPIYAWHENETVPFLNLTSSPGTIYSLFATPNGKIFAGIFTPSNVSEIHMWVPNEMNSTILTTTTTFCAGLFVDDVDRLYCSLRKAYSIIMLQLNDSTNTSSSIAGGSEVGNTSDLLNSPAGIFVTNDYQLYVADSSNNRIQLFLPGHSNATTVAGMGAPGTVALSLPWDVVLDAHEFMFIVDSSNNRVVGEGPSGFLCIAGCRNTYGSGDDQLFFPQSLSFDSHGNLFVADTFNSRIQKFLLTTKPCGEFFQI